MQGLMSIMQRAGNFLVYDLQNAAQSGNLPGWVWVLIVIIIIAVFWGILYNIRASSSSQEFAALSHHPAEEAPATNVDLVSGPEDQLGVLAVEAPYETEQIETAPPPTLIEQTEFANPQEAPGALAFTLENEPVKTAPVLLEDDLIIIEGIGPKIAGVLKSAGVVNFAQLAAMNPAEIRQILHAAHLQLADPTSWPEQARLAAAGDLEGLKVLQSQLKAGRQSTS